MPSQDQFVLTNRDVISIDFQQKTGHVGIVNIVRVPLDKLDALKEGENDGQDSLQLAATLLQVTQTLTMPRHFLLNGEDFDFDNPLSEDMMQDPETFSIAERVTKVVKSSAPAFFHLQEENGEKQDFLLVSVLFQDPEEGEEGSLGFALGGIGIKKSFDELSDEDVAELFDSAKENLPEEMLDNSDITLTQWHRLSETPTSMNLSPLHTTDYREYRAILDPRETSIHNVLLRPIDKDEVEARMKANFAKLSGELGVDLKGLFEHMMSESEMSEEDFTLHTLFGLCNDIREGHDVPYGLLAAACDKFIELKGDSLPAPLLDPQKTFFNLLGTPEAYGYTYGIEEKNGRKHILFSPWESSSLLIANSTDVNREHLVLAATTYVPMDFSGVQTLDLTKVEEELRKEDIEIPIGDIEEVHDLTDEFADTLRHSFVVSFVLAMMEDFESQEPN